MEVPDLLHMPTLFDVHLYRGVERKRVDPGIPNAWPMKEQLLQEIEACKQKALEEKKQQRQKMSLEELVADAHQRGEEFAEQEQDQLSKYDGFTLASNSDATATGLRDNSKKAYYKEFRKVVENADVILEVLDARDPLGCRTKKIEELIMHSGRQKRIVLVLNKIDLVPRAVAEQWLKYLRREFPTVAFKASTQQQRSHLGQSSVQTHLASDRALNTSECLGADQLVQLLKNYSRSLGLKTAITVGVIGYPNVGKSSVINSLKRSKVCGVGATPGLTKATQEIALDKNLKLLDCPGIVFSHGSTGAEAILRNCVKVELLDDPIAPVEVILRRCKVEQLTSIYGIPAFRDVQDFLVQMARQRGRLLRGGIPDTFSAARAVLQDWNCGKIPYYTLPPAPTQEESADLGSAVVQGWSKEFNIEALVKEEKEMLDQAAAGEDETAGENAFVAAMPGISEVDMDAVPDISEQEEDEEEEDFEMDEDEDDSECPDAVAMETDEEEEEEEEPVFAMAPIKKRKAGATVPSMQKRQQPAALSSIEAELDTNQQTGKAQKKLLKKQKKEQQKTAATAASMHQDNDDIMVDGEDDAYDFQQFHRRR